MIIKLTEVRKDGPYPTYVNMDHVQYFSKSINGGDTRLKIYGDNLYLFVKESIDEIMNKMSPPKMAELPDSRDHAYGADAHIIYGAR